MSYVVTTGQMRAAEDRAVKAGTPEPDLMRAAAGGIVSWIEDQFHDHGQTRTVLGLIGPGKNGGDALVTIALLAELGWSAHAVLIDRDEPGNLPVDKSLLKNVNISSSIPDLEDTSTLLVLDGLYGIGGRPSLPEQAVAIVSAVADLRTYRELAVIAVDVPSGIDSDSGEASPDALPADATLTVGALKTGLMYEPAATLAGEVVTIDIGLQFGPDECIAPMVAASDIAPALPKRMATAGKHDYGGLLVVGGAPMYFGAPRLCAEGALLAGTGLVGAAVPRMIVSTIAIQVPEVVFVPLSDSDGRKSSATITEALTGEHSRYTAAVLGPGLGQDDAAKDLLQHLFGQATTRRAAPIGFGAVLDGDRDETSEPTQSALASVPLVLDADALNWLASQEDRWSFLENVIAVLTPHAGELARLRDESVDDIKQDRIAAAMDTARQSNQVVVLKGGYTVIAAPDGRVSVAQRPTPELATPGTGDVLAGLIGGLLAQGMDPYAAACAAVYIGAEAGRRARYATSSRSVLARDLLANIGAALDDIDGTIW